VALSNDLSYKANFSVNDVTRNLRNLRPSYELREQWLYNNMVRSAVLQLWHSAEGTMQMYMVGAEVVSTLSGMRLADFVNDRIFKPLGMNYSTYSIDAATQTGKFSETWSSFGRLIPPWIEEEFEDLIAGPAGVISSVEELVRHVMWESVNVYLMSWAGVMGQNEPKQRYQP
jgi:CubicO group peptidase (beta-lactamase class C family)